MTRAQHCLACGEPIVWLCSWGLGEPRPFDLRPVEDGTADGPQDGIVVVDPATGRVRAVAADDLLLETAPVRLRPHWPCSAPEPAGATPHDEPHPLPVAVVPHTHWDREWYEPFQVYRNWLVHRLDDLIDLLEADDRYGHFTLDGQTAMVDDYLEVRPEQEGRLRALARAGRVALGPWVTLADEFMVSGETLVRNLQDGVARARELAGREMKVGYAPDTFGHVAQLPQLLRLGGIAHALVWRGVPHRIGTTAFWWVAPDGSRVRAEFLPHGYGHGTRVPTTGDELVARTRDYHASVRDRLVGGLLLMNGSDHHPANPRAGVAVVEANELQSDYRFAFVPLETWLASEPTDDLPEWRGELRSSGRHSVIMGVTSNRMDVKRAAAVAEGRIERHAEPGAALWLPAERYPHGSFAVAWRELERNAAHDSSCACSADEVVQEVLTRYHAARQVGDAVLVDVLRSLAARADAPAGSVLVANPSGVARAALVDVVVPGSGPSHLVTPEGVVLPTSVLPAADPGDRFRLEGVRGEAVVGLASVLGDSRFGVVEIGAVRTVESARPGERETAGGVLRVELVERLPDDKPVDLAPVAERMRAAASTGEVVDLVVRAAPRRRLVASVPVPALGWTALHVHDGPGPDGPMRSGDGWIANEHIRVDVAADGTFALEDADGLRVEGLGRLVDGGDGGDTYNWSPPTEDLIVDTPHTVDHRVVECGAARAVLEITATYEWPERGEGDEHTVRARSATLVPIEVTTQVELRASEPVARIRTRWDDRCEDHRLRAHLPLPAPVDGSDAGCAFAVVHRPLRHEGNAYEAPMGTYPARRFVDASDGRVGLAVLHDGVVEYDVVVGEDGQGHELAVTLARCVGWLSRDGMALRAGGAGPRVALADAQLPGPQEARYGVHLHRGDWEQAGLDGLAAMFVDEPDVLVLTSDGDGTWSPGTRLEVEGASVSAVQRDRGGRLVVRVVRMASTPGELEVRWDGDLARGEVVDLLGEELEPFAGTRPLRPFEIATVRLEDLGM